MSLQGVVARRLLLLKSFHTFLNTSFYFYNIHFLSVFFFFSNTLSSLILSHVSPWTNSSSIDSYSYIYKHLQASLWVRAQKLVPLHHQLPNLGSKLPFTVQLPFRDMQDGMTIISPEKQGNVNISRPVTSSSNSRLSNHPVPSSRAA